MRAIRTVFFCILCLTLVTGVCGSSAGDKRADGRLVVLFTHDLHSYFLPQRLPASSGKMRTEGGYAKLATLIGKYRDRYGASRSLLVDAGDFSMGTLFQTAFMTHALELNLMGRMGYDVMTFGNHDFDFHPDGLAKAMNAAKASTPVLPAIVSSNTVFGPPKGNDRSLREAFKNYPVRDYIVIERNGVRIGLFGILGKDARTDTPFARPLTFADPVATGRRVVEILKNKERVDLIVCLSHSGTSPVKAHSEDEILARDVPEIDVIVSGHTHTVLAQPITVGKTIIVSAGSYGRHLGILELAFDRENRKARLVSYGIPKVTDEIPDDPAFAGDIASFKPFIDGEYLKPHGMRFDQIVAESGYDMTSLSDAYARPGEMGLGDMITDAYRYAIEQAEGQRYDHVHLVIQPLGHIRSTLLAGGVTTSDIFGVLSLGIGVDGTPGYPLLSAYLSAAEIKKLLEVETTVASIKCDAHLQFSGIRFTYNPHRVPFDRVTAVLIRQKDGSYETLNPDRLYRVAMNYYAAQMVHYISEVSHGLLGITPKDRQGRPISDLRAAVIPAGPGNRAIREIKEWAALAAYMKSFPDPDGNGVPNIPDRYRNPEGRLTVLPSWNPVQLVSGGTIITYSAIGLFLLMIAIFVLSAWFVIRFVRRRATHKGGKAKHP